MRVAGRLAARRLVVDGRDHGQVAAAVAAVKMRMRDGRSILRRGCRRSWHMEQVSALLSTVIVAVVGAGGEHEAARRG